MSETPDAVYFVPEDYASIGRRLIAFLTDLAVVTLICFGITLAISTMVVPRSAFQLPGDTPEARAERAKRISQYTRPYQPQMLVAISAAVLGYHVLLRTSRAGTLGYRLAGVRLVTSRGEPPSLRTAGRRFLMAVPLCGLIGMSYLKCLSDPRRQALHDRFTGTWVVLRNARPAGPAAVEFQFHMFGPFAFKLRSLSPVPVATHAAAQLP